MVGTIHAEFCKGQGLVEKATMVGGLRVGVDMGLEEEASKAHAGNADDTGALEGSDEAHEEGKGGLLLLEGEGLQLLTKDMGPRGDAPGQALPPSRKAQPDHPAILGPGLAAEEPFSLQGLDRIADGGWGEVELPG